MAAITSPAPPAAAGVPRVSRVLVATDRSATADQAVRWAANLAAAHAGEGLVFRGLVSVTVSGEPVSPAAEVVERASQDLRRFAETLAGPRGRARVAVDPEPAEAILAAIDALGVDMVV